MDKAQENRPLTAEENDLRKELKRKSLGLASLERTIARMRSRVTWVLEGDACTRFFQIQSTYRRQKNRILRLKIEHGLAITHKEKAGALFAHYTKIMGTEGDRTQVIDLEAIGIKGTQLDHLDAPFIEAELWETIKPLPNDKAPGPNGFTAEFYRSAWSVIRGDMLLAMNAFNRADWRGWHGVNNALITLLPKKVDAEEPGDYRPICLIHSFAKLMAKMMARRLAPELDKLVDVNQSAFIQKRSIHNNFRFIQASAKLFKQRKIPKLLLKLDIAKAFDTVSWPFLLQVLQQHGFGPRWRN